MYRFSRSRLTVRAWLQGVCQSPRLSTIAAQRNLPFRAAESEAVGQLPTEGVPESRLLFIFQPEQLIVVVLHLLVFFVDLGAVTVFTILSLAAANAATTSTAASATASASTTL